MTPQRDAIPSLLQRLAPCAFPVALLLGGSVALNSERLDSDLDLFAIAEHELDPFFPDFTLVSRKNGCRLLESRAHGFPIHLACWTTASMDHVLQTVPYMTYPILLAIPVHDPANLAALYQHRMKAWFDAHPQLRDAWERQLHDLRLYKSGQLQHLAHPQWSDFLRHLEATGIVDISSAPRIESSKG